MMQALLVPFIFVAGALQAFGAVMSAQLRASLANPWLASAVAFAINAFFFSTLFAYCLVHCRRCKASRRCPGGRRWPGSSAPSP
jgi:uncharacterized membrane protein YdcZ (DUF606 family)